MIKVDKDFDWLARRLEFHEGFKDKPYKCSKGKLTIGIGHNIEAREFTEAEKRALGDWRHGITRNAALMLLRNDIAICLKQLSGIDFYAKLDIERQYALLDMCFQLGYEGLCKFKKMLDYMRWGKFQLASKECLDSLYAQQTPARARRIAKLISDGIWLRK